MCIRNEEMKRKVVLYEMFNTDPVEPFLILFTWCLKQQLIIFETWNSTQSPTQKTLWASLSQPAYHCVGVHRRPSAEREEHFWRSHHPQWASCRPPRGRQSTKNMMNRNKPLTISHGLSKPTKFIRQPSHKAPFLPAGAGWWRRVFVVGCSCSMWLPGSSDLHNQYASWNPIWKSKVQHCSLKINCGVKN